jgi:hypothetical protein
MRSILVHLREETASNWGGGRERSRWARGEFEKFVNETYEGFKHHLVAQ